MALCLIYIVTLCLSTVMLATSEKQLCRVIYANGSKRIAIILCGPSSALLQGSLPCRTPLVHLHRLKSKQAFQLQFQHQLPLGPLPSVLAGSSLIFLAPSAPVHSRVCYFLRVPSLPTRAWRTVPPQTDTRISH